MVKCLSTMRETGVRALGLEDPLEKEMAIHSSTLAWKILWTEERGRVQSMGLQRVGYDLVTKQQQYAYISLINKIDKHIFYFIYVCISYMYVYMKHAN